MKTVFADGEYGTTGLEIVSRLESREDIRLLSIPAESRRDRSARKDLLNQADLAMLCLPDDAARDAVALVENDRTKIVDASTAHRTAPGWVYGMPEIHGQRTLLSSAVRISNAGCYATGFVLLLRPLADGSVLPNDYPVVTYAITGYTGGGKQMISAFETTPSERQHEFACRPKDFHLNHKHLPEMQLMARLKAAPHFLPIVGNFPKGMLVLVPLHCELLSPGTGVESIHSALSDYYSGERFVRVMPLNHEASLVGGFLCPQGCNGTNRVELFVYENRGHVLLVARLDNLGKGASGAAVQNMNIALGLEESEGLR